MTNSCPECGTSMEFEDHEVRLKTGVCPSCSKEFAFVQGTSVAARMAAPPGGESAEEGAAAIVPGEGPECEECGSPLQIREGRAGSLKVVCPECETTTTFVPQRERPREGRERGRPEGSDAEPPRGRPCRQCGAPLRFSTGEDGMLVGECDACGNRFTLPPRTGGPGGGRGFRGGPSYGRRDYRSNGGGGGRFPSRGGRPFRSDDRRGRPRDDDDRRPKRRRPRDE